MISFWQVLALGALLVVLLFSFTWLLSRRLNNYSFVDITWSYSFAVLAVLFAATSEGFLTRRVIILAMVVLWSLRLGTYLLLRIKRHHPHEDVRYQAMRAKWSASLGSKFFIFFQAQALSVLLLVMPCLIAMRNSTPSMGLIEWIGLGVWCIGICGEAMSDRQMNCFKINPANKGKVCNVGLWRWSRHPNYFFESVIWWGFWLFACGSPQGWLTIYAPLSILWLLLRVTGIPLTEKCAVESKGDLYREYQRTTSAFVPWFSKSL